MTRKIRASFGLLLTVVLLALSVSAFAAVPTVTSEIPVNVYPGEPQTIFNIQYNGSAYDWLVTRDDNGIIGPVIDRTGPIAVETLFGQNEASSVAVPWNYLYDGDFIADDIGYPHMLTVWSEGIASTVVNFYVNYMSELGFDQVSFISQFDETVGLPEAPKPVYYDHNTVCSFGPHFRNVSPDLTDKWYMFTPIDLSKDGTQAFELVGGNVYIIGKAAVTVEGDKVTVTYEYFNDDVWHRGDFFTIFPDYDSITTVNPDEIEKGYTFGEPISIEKDLNGDKEVILFIRNVATFRDDNPAIVRFWENIKWRKELRESMLAFIGKAPQEEAAK